MSTQIDERVVAMRFDNKQFEAGCAQSMSTLEKLQAKLNFSGAAKGFENLEKSANNVTLSGLTKSAEAVEVKFSTMSIVAITAIERIVNSAMDAGEKLVKSMSIDQITTGFSKYESKINAVQATLNAVRDQGIGLEEVNAVMDKLSWYADETSYHFDSMSNAMSQFIAAGIDFNGIEDLIMGISNACGLAGVNAQKAEYAMTGFNKAIGQGYMTNAVWQNQLKTSGITNSKEFRQILIDTAAEMGTLTKVGEGMYKTLKGNSVTVGDINSNFSDMWLNTNVMTAAFRKFGSFSSKAFELCEETGIEASEAIKQLAGSTYEFSEAGFRASQEAKTFTDAIGAVQEAVSARWSKTFELIIGDEEEAIELWTNVTESLLEVFAYGGDKRNKMLEDWKSAGGRASLLRGISLLWNTITTAAEAAKKAFDEVFPPMTGERLNKLTKQFALFANKLQLSEKSAYTLKVVVKTLLLPLQLFFVVLKAGVAIIARVTTEVFKLINGFLSLLATDNAIEEFFEKLLGTERYERLAAALTKIGDRIRGVFSRIGERINIAFGNTNLLQLFQTALGKIVDILTPIAYWILDRIIDGLEAIANMDFTPVKKFFSWIADGFEETARRATNVYSLLSGGFENFVKQFKGKTFGESISMMSQKFLGLFQLATQMKNSFNISGIFDSINNSSSGLINSLTRIGDKISELVGKLEPAKILVFSFGAGIVAFTLQMANAAKAATSMFSSISGVVSAIKTRIQGDKITKIAKAIAILAGSLILMSLIDAERLKQATISMMALMAGLVVVSASIAAIEKFLVKGNDEGLLKFSLILISISGSVLILAAALATLSAIGMEGMIAKLLTLGAVMAALVVASKVMAKGTPQLTKGSLFLLAFALSISTVINSLEKLAKSDLAGIQSNLTTLILVMGLMTVLSAAAGKISFSGAAGITVMAANLLLLVKTMHKLNEINVASLMQSIRQFIVLIGMIAALGLAARVAGQSSVKAAVSIAMMSGVMLLLIEVARQAGELDSKVAKQGLAAVIAFGTLFTVIIAVSSAANENADKVGKGLLSMSIALLLLGLSVKYLGELDLKTIVQGGVAVSAFLALFTYIAKIGKAGEKEKSSLGSMALVIGTLVASIALLTLLDYKEVLMATAALSAVLIAFGVCMKNLQEIKLGTALANIIMVGAVISVMSAALMGLSGMNGEGLVAKATALSILVAALTIVSTALSKTDLDVKAASKGAAAIIAVTSILGLFVSAIGVLFGDPKFTEYIVNGGSLIKQLAMISPWIAIFGMIAILLSKFPINIASASLGAAAIDAVIAIVGGLVISLGALDDLLKGKAGKWLEDGGQMLAKIGTAIGAFVGNLVSALVGGLATGGLPVIADNLAAFSEKIVPFFENITSIDETTVASAKSVADSLTSISNINTSALSKNNTALIDFADQLVEMADPMIEYSNKIRQIDVNTVNASSGLISSIANLLNSLPTEGGFLNSIFGEKSFGAFSGLSEFASGIKEYSDVLTKDGGINTDAISSSATAIQIMSDLANGLPKTGGKWQEWFGETDLAKFGEDLVAFGESLVDYNRVLMKANPKLDEKLIKSSGNAAEVLVKLAQELPKSGGRWQEWFGGTDLVGFGEDLVAFGSALVQYNSIILGADPAISANAISATADVGQMMVELEKALPKSGGWWQGVTGSQDIGDFGEKLAAFGTSIANYGKNVSNISGSKIKESATAASTLATVSREITEVGWGKMNDAGIMLSSFGGNLSKYYNYIEPINWSTMSSANRAVKNLSEAFESVKNVDTKIPDLTKIMKSYQPDFKETGEYLVSGFVSGINGKTNTVKTAVSNTMETTLKSAISKLDVVNKSSREFETVGKNAVQGLANGINNNQSIANKAADTLANGILKTTQNALGIHSPSVVFEKEVGKWIVKGIAEGITKDMSAEEAASKKASNIVAAFQTALENIDISASLRSSKFSFQKLLWPEDMTEDEQYAKELDDLNGQLMESLDTVRIWQAEYAKMVNDYGENSNNAKEALTSLYKAQSNLLNVAKQIEEIQNRNVKTEAENRQAFDAYIEFINGGAEQDYLTTKTIEERLNKRLETYQKKLESAKGDEREELLLKITDTQKELEENRRKGLSTFQKVIESMGGAMTDEELAAIQAQQDQLNASIREWEQEIASTSDQKAITYLQNLIDEANRRIAELEATKKTPISEFYEWARRETGYDPNGGEKVTAEQIIKSYLPSDVDIKESLNWWGDTVENEVVPKVTQTASKVGTSAASASKEAAKKETQKNGGVFNTIIEESAKEYDGEGAAKLWNDYVLEPGTKAINKLGSFFGVGYSNGEDDAKADIKKSAEGIVETAVTAVQEAQDSHSPSVVAQGLGNDFGDGYVLGIEDSRVKILEAVTIMIKEMMEAVETRFEAETPNLASSFSKTITEAAARAEALADGGTFTIRPVLDMSTVEKQLQEFSSKVSATTAHSASAEITASGGKIQNGTTQTTNIVNNYNQTINTQKVTSPLEIVRRTKNLMSQIIGGATK